MRKLTCQSCGRSYDYDKDDLCPKCGCFNSPRDGSSTKLERDLLSRFEGLQKAAPRYVPQSRGAAHELDGRKHGARIDDCESKPKFRASTPNPTRVALGQTRPASGRSGKKESSGLVNALAAIAAVVAWFLLRALR